MDNNGGKVVVRWWHNRDGTTPHVMAMMLQDELVMREEE